MPKYKIEFKHTVRNHHIAEIEAENEADASQKFYNSPFEYVAAEEPDDIDGLIIDIVKITELKEKN